ncbi:SRPBCC family protein [Pilimelia terevasa]|uniref:SRPBCC family protein n=1 Tax=Pilimelia terevasa TaxID=53372 RepID=UPI001E4BB6AF|nr:SRPBCC family protein [Pilimelia terevasa]
MTQHVAAPDGLVWDLLADVAGRREWLSTAGAVEALTPPPFAVGTRWRETHRMPDGEQVAEEYRVDECVPGRRFVITSPGDGAAYRTSYTITPVTSGRHLGETLVTVAQHGHAEGRRARLLEVVLGGLAVRTAEGALRQELADLAAAAARRRDDPGAPAA